MSSAVDPFLLCGAALSAIAALLHVGCIVFGAPWYRFFGAGERMARLAEAGDWRPAAVTAPIVVVLSAWSLYALSGAGAIPPLPGLWPALLAIASVYTLRGLAGVAYAALRRPRDRAFWWWSSAICLVFGATHWLGIAEAWPRR